VQLLRGIGAAKGWAVGPAWILDPALAIPERRISPDQVRLEMLRLEHALEIAEAHLGHSRSGSEEGELAEDYEGWEIERLQLTDGPLAQACRRLIRDEQVSAETAVRRAMNEIESAFEETEASPPDEGADVEAVGDRLKVPERGAALAPPVGAVAIARDFHEDEIVELKRAGVAAIATEHGSETSPLATAARALGLPYVTSVEGVARLALAGMTVAIDGDRGHVILDPEDPTLRDFHP
jgi:phosphotransferase system enzyme I (PtsI)